MRVGEYVPTQEFGGSEDGAHAVLARAPNIKGRYGSGVESGDSTPTSIHHPLPSFSKVLVGVDSPTIINTLTYSCGVVVCVYTHNITNSSPFIAALVCGGGGMGSGQFTLFHTVKKTTLAQKIKKNMLILNQLCSVTF